MCYEPIEHDEEEINGVCPSCKTPTIDGKAAIGCYYSAEECEVCGYSPCDDSC